MEDIKTNVRYLPLPVLPNTHTLAVVPSQSGAFGHEKKVEEENESASDSMSSYDKADQELDEGDVPPPDVKASRDALIGMYAKMMQDILGGMADTGEMMAK